MTKNFGHRGFSGQYPENTMLAFRKAVEAGVDGIEMDVQLSKDGVPMICHDEKIDRTTNGTGWLKDYTAAELKQFDASYRFPEMAGPDATIPTLEEYLAFAKEAGIVTNIELKTGVFEFEGIEKKVMDMVASFGLQDKIIYSSFNHYTMLRVRALDPNAVCGFLMGDWIINAGAYTASHGMNAYHPEHYNLTPEIVAEVKSHGLMINTWTVNETADVKRLAALGIDTIIGNEPVNAAKALKEYYDSLK